MVFVVEREILEKAKHPFIPKLAWYFENEKKIFIVMEFVEGGGRFIFPNEIMNFFRNLTPHPP